MKLAGGALIIAIAGALAWATAQSRPERGPVNAGLRVPGDTCEYSIPDSIILTPQERCFIDVHTKRCTSDDQCIVTCLASGTARDIGGGCWHMCFAYRAKMWSNPPGMDACHPDSLASGPANDAP